MILWIDAQLSPSMARWLATTLGLQAVAVRELGLRDAKDRQIFFAAREAGAVVMSKDADFVLLLQQFGAPPQILWVTCGNTSNAYLRSLLSATLPSALELLERGEALVEISDAH